MSQKTPGQIAYEAYETHLRDRGGYAVPWASLPWQHEFEAAANALIEMCAKVAEEHGATSEMELRYLRQKKGPEWHAHLRSREIAAALRNLKVTANG